VSIQEVMNSACFRNIHFETDIEKNPLFSGEKPPVNNS